MPRPFGQLVHLIPLLMALFMLLATMTLAQEATQGVLGDGTGGAAGILSDTEEGTGGLHEQTMTFGDEAIDGQTAGPGGELIEGQTGFEGPSLIPIRNDFNQEVIDSGDDN